MVINLEHIKPHPLPAIYPHWEYAAEDSLRASYEDYKTRFQVPWVGVVTMAYAHYQNFFNTWWDAMKPMVDHQVYVDIALSLREQIEVSVQALNPPPLTEKLTKLGYSSRELDEIIEMVDVISHGNFIQIPAVIAARVLLEGSELNGGTEIGPIAAPHKPSVTTPFVLIEPHHGLNDLKSVYENVKTTLGLPFVNTDYRCLSRWPSYFDMAWGDLRGHIGTADYESLALDNHNAMIEAAQSLPNPANITSAALQQATILDANLEDIRQTTRLFSWLIPGLVTNVAFFRAQLINS